MGQAADVVREKIAAFNAQDAERIRALMSPDIEWAIPGGLLRGPDEALIFFAALWEAFPDLHLTITRLAEHGSTAILQGRDVATHQGTFHTPGGDIAPTGARVDLTFSECYEVEDGVIVSARLIFDRLELLEQLGVTPAPAAA